MRLHILSDLHLEHGTITVPKIDADVLVLAGDILTPGHRALVWATRVQISQGRPVVQVAGNHEFYDREMHSERVVMRETARRLGVHFLDRTSVVIDDVRFLGCTLWTDYRVPILDTAGTSHEIDPARGMAACARSLTDHSVIRWADGEASRLVTPGDLLAEHLLDRAWLEAQLAMPFAGATVVITHHAPHPLSIAQEYGADWVTTGFVNDLPAAFFTVPVLWIHGHTHTRFDYHLGHCRVVCNPRGYRRRNGSYEVDGFDPAFVVNV